MGGGGGGGDFLLPTTTGCGVPMATTLPMKRTLSPTVTGGTVVGIALKDCVLVCTDTLGSYGKMARFKGVPRFSNVGNTTVVCASGEYSDFQYIDQLLQEKASRDWMEKDGSKPHPKDYSSYLSRIFAVRRNKLNPLWNSMVVGGFGDGKAYLSYIDMYGTFFEENYVATSFGRYFAITLLRDRYKPDMTEVEARKLIEDCMRIGFYRDCMASDEIQFAKITPDGVAIEQPYRLNTTWNLEGWTAKTSDMSLAGCSW